MRGNQANGQSEIGIGFQHLKGEEFVIAGERWKVIKFFKRRKCDWARLCSMDRKKVYKSTTVDFLQMISKRKAS